VSVVQGEGQEVAWCACRVGAVRTEGRRAGACTHVARARTRIASISHFRAGWDGDGGKGGGKGGGGEALRAKKTVTIVRAAKRRGW